MDRSMVILLFLSLVALTHAWRPSWLPPLSDTTCGFTREDAIKCAMENVDTDKDGRITVDETEAAITNHMPTWMRLYRWAVGTQKVMQDCDYNADGVITVRDMTLATEKCLPTQENLCAFKWFCDKVKTKE